jgi:hypothetical protein
MKVVLLIVQIGPAITNKFLWQDIVLWHLDHMLGLISIREALPCRVILTLGEES